MTNKHEKVETFNNQQLESVCDLTVDKLPCVVQEVGHQDPVNNHGSYEGHHGENQTGPLTKLPEVVPTDIREFPVRRVHVGCADKKKIFFVLSFWYLNFFFLNK